MTDDKSDKLALYKPSNISDRVTPEQSIEALHAKIAPMVNNGYRDYTRLSPDERAELADYLHRMADRIVPTPMHIGHESIPLPERIKRVYPMIYRAYHTYIGTGQCNFNIVDEKIGTSFFVNDAFYSDPKNIARSCCVSLGLAKDTSAAYQILVWHHGWKRLGNSYGHSQIIKTSGIIRRLLALKPSIDVCSEIFKIDFMSLPNFVNALSAGGDQMELRQATLDHLLSLPEILNPLLDAKEKGQLVRR